ncbi:MAG TPA: DUF2079 domain-containing protein [Candidatus Baltobacteraceae bacterium]|nr:DUF2079 domain-containing protein [Candidatus Baltobacteraceae bacterium]
MTQRILAPARLTPVYAAAAVFAVVYFALDLNKLYALRYGADFGTFLQTIVNMMHGSSWNFGEWRQHLEVHDSWILFGLAPLIALFPRAETLIAVQVTVVALAAIPLALFAREIGVSNRSANLLAIAYLLTPSAQGFTYDNFSENVFVPVLAFSLALAVRRRAFWPALILTQFLMGVKEDEILFVAWFAAACYAFWDRRLGAAAFLLAALNVALFWGIERWLGVHPSVPAYALSIEDLGGKLTLVALLLAPFAFAPALVGRWLLLAVPLFAEIAFAQHTPYETSRIGTHYTAPLLACAAIAAAFGIRRYPALVRAMIPCALIVMLLVFNDTVLRPGRWPFIVDWQAYAAAVSVRQTKTPILLQRRDEGVWAVAAVNPLVELKRRPDPHFVACPGYNTNAAAFFASLGIGRWQNWHLCGGVPEEKKN